MVDDNFAEKSEKDAENAETQKAEESFADKINAFGADAYFTEARNVAGTSLADSPEALLDDRKATDAAASEDSEFARDPEAAEWRRGFNDTEFSAESAPAPIVRPKAERFEQKKEDEGNEQRGINLAVIGWVALGLSIAALFLWPAVLGSAGVVLGFIAYVRGSRSLGVWSIVIGLVAFVAYIVITPFYS